MADLERGHSERVRQHEHASDEAGRDALRVVQEFMTKTRTQGKVIFAVITGSRAYNVNVEVCGARICPSLRVDRISCAGQGSDYDYKAVYLAPTESWLGLDQPRDPGAPYELHTDCICLVLNWMC